MYWEFKNIFKCVILSQEENYFDNKYVYKWIDATVKLNF